MGVLMVCSPLAIPIDIGGRAMPAERTSSVKEIFSELILKESVNPYLCVEDSSAMNKLCGR